MAGDLERTDDHEGNGDASLAPLLEDTREQAEELRSLRHVGPLDASNVSPIAKIPYKARILRECLLHRVFELVDSACDDAGQGRSVACVLNARAALESASMLCWLHRKIKRAVDDESIDGVDEFLMKGLFGRRDVETELGSHHVLPAVKKVDSFLKRASGHPDSATRFYDGLSETAHPNYEGVMLSFLHDIDDRRCEIGASFTDDLDGRLSYGLRAVRFAIGVAARFHGDLAKLDRPFRELCESALPG